MKKRRKTTTGVSRIARLAFLLICLIAAAPGQRDKKAVPQAVIAGTIFREPGFAVAGAEAVLTADRPPAGVKKFKPLKTSTAARGEFFFYLPAAEAVYRVKASAPGLQPQEREVQIHGEERVDVYFNLKPLPQ